MNTVLLYGATGYMGRLVAGTLVESGLRPILCGRDSASLPTLANQSGLEHRVAELTDTNAIDRALSDVAVLLNAAGPFSSTAHALVEACLRCGVHYLDLTGEVVVLENIRARDLDARRRGIMLLPGVGFDVVPSDCLAAYVVASLPGACTLRLAIAGLELTTRGSARTIADQFGRPLLVRRNGQLSAVNQGPLERSFAFSEDPRPARPNVGVAVSWGDLATAYHTTGIPNIETYFQATPAVRATVAATAAVGPFFRLPPWRQTLDGLVRWLPDGPSPSERARRTAVIVAEAEDSSGRIKRARLRTPEAYTLSAETAAAIVARVTDGDCEPGYQTPATMFGANYILGFEGVYRDEPPDPTALRC